MARARRYIPENAGSKRKLQAGEQVPAGSPRIADGKPCI
jgi:hypothetical protein